MKKIRNEQIKSSKDQKINKKLDKQIKRLLRGSYIIIWTNDPINIFIPGLKLEKLLAKI